VSLSSIEAAEIYNRVAMGYMGSLDLTYDHQRILLNGSSYSNPVFYFEINGYLDSGSTQPAYVADCGTTNDGVGNCTDTSTFIDLNFTPSSERIRSSSFSIIDGHRYALSVVPGGGPNMFLANAFVVIAIH